MESVVAGLRILRRCLQRIGPYLLVEIFLPGGTLLALLLFLYRRGRLGAGDPAAAGTALVPAVLSIIGHGASKVASMSH
jgi:hypothetical protein